MIPYIADRRSTLVSTVEPPRIRPLSHDCILVDYDKIISSDVDTFIRFLEKGFTKYVES